MSIKNMNSIWPWAIATGLFILCVYLVKGILLPFIAGLLVAYAMTPGVVKMEKMGLSRSIATTIMVVGFCVSIILLLFIAIPFLQTELVIFAKQVPNYSDRIWQSTEPLIDWLSAYLAPSDMARIRETASSYAVDVISWGIKVVVNVLTSSLAIANLISLVVITPILAFYFLRDWNLIIDTIDSYLPRDYAASIRRIFFDINTTIGGFARGQGLVCLFLGIYYSIMLTIADLDFSITVGMVIGFFAFVPYVGAIIGFLLSIGIALAQFSDWWSIGIVASIFAVGQTIEGYILIPRLVGDRIGLHPVWVMFSILAGGVIYGFVGILFALPIAAAIGVLVRFGLATYKKSTYYIGHSAKGKNK